MFLMQQKLLRWYHILFRLRGTYRRWESNSMSGKSEIFKKFAAKYMT
jgi:hypothetical protein